MADTTTPDDTDRAQRAAAAALTKADLSCTFGPSFFLGHLGRFVRDHCPDPNENLPIVQVHLATGEILDICHIVGVSPRWAMLAVRDSASHAEGMAVELVSYELIQRVSIRTRRVGSASIGFSQIVPPEIIAPETLLRAAMPQITSA
ncbi:MAG: hypothetical protein K2Y23_04065 [Cyanobacteria bacterium]|nr:hypothetical protein [Cyanobacteriota bacterium]